MAKKTYCKRPQLNPDSLREILIDYSQRELNDLKLAFSELFESQTLLHPEEEQNVRDVFEKFKDASQLGDLTRPKRTLVLSVIEEFIEDDESSFFSDDDC